MVITYSGNAKEEWKLKICVDFKKFNKATKKILILCQFLMRY